MVGTCADWCFNIIAFQDEEAKIIAFEDKKETENKRRPSRNWNCRQRKRFNKWRAAQAEKEKETASPSLSDQPTAPVSQLLLVSPPPKTRRPHPRRTRKTCEYDMARLQERLGDEGFAYEVATSTTMGRLFRKHVSNVWRRSRPV